MKKFSNKKLKNLLKGIFGILVFIFLVVFIGLLCTNGKEEINPFQHALYITLFYALFFGGIVLIFFFIYIVFNYLTEINIQITKLNKEDFINNKQLYRDILNEYSPVLLVYIDKMKFDYDLSVISGLLSLKNKGYIEICEDKLNIVKYDFYNLDMPERYIIENIRNGKVENANQLKDMVYEEGKKKGLLISNEKWTGMFPKGIKNLMFFSIIYFFIMYPIFEVLISLFNNAIVLKDVIPIAMFLVYIYVCFYAIKFQENSYSRSKSAEELNQKLEGLKNYIDEYSLLKEKTSEDITLWEDYLIYSVIFNQNNDIVEEYKRYY